MTAPARPVPRTGRPPTRDQLLVLVDRAERGRLTAAEADRLRQGIQALLADRRRQRSTPAIKRTLRLRRLVDDTRHSGHRMVPLAALEAALGPPQARQAA